MLRITPIKLHYGERLPAEAGESPDFFSVERMSEPNTPSTHVEWVADFPSVREAGRYITFLGGTSPSDFVSADQAAEALDSLDDCARMDLGVDAAGPRGVLERFIAQNQ